MIELARAALADPTLTRRLADLARGAPASAPLSLAVPLGPGREDWLSALPGGAPFTYLARPAADRWTLGLGSALEYASSGNGRFAALQNAIAGIHAAGRWAAPPPLFFAFSFASDCDEAPAACLRLPALILDCRAGSCTLVLNALAGSVDGALRDAATLLGKPDRRPATPLQRQFRPLPDRAWLARVSAALRDIAAGRAEKLVLAREAVLEAGAPIPPGPALAALLERQPECLTYALGDGTKVFLGATPEALVSLDGRLAQADALAGTAWTTTPVGVTDDLDSDKNRREQAHVAAAVGASLGTLCEEVRRTGADETVVLPHLRHRRTRFIARARDGINLLDLVAALHPTPAVGGYPTPAALAWLAAHGERRGAWYSGGIGEIGAQGQGEAWVALRCAWLCGHEARLWAGAGIVAGSDPERELAETEVKLQTMVEALCHPPRPAPATGPRQASAG